MYQIDIVRCVLELWNKICISFTNVEVIYDCLANISKGVYRVSIVKRPLLSTLPFLLAF